MGLQERTGLFFGSLFPSSRCGRPRPIVTSEIQH